jgi:hypothetical protein
MALLDCVVQVIGTDSERDVLEAIGFLTTCIACCSRATTGPPGELENCLISKRKMVQLFITQDMMLRLFSATLRFASSSEHLHKLNLLVLTYLVLGADLCEFLARQSIADRRHGAFALAAPFRNFSSWYSAGARADEWVRA